MKFNSVEDFLDYIVTDEELQRKFLSAANESDIKSLLSDCGATFSPIEVRDVFLERHGSELNETQLESIAGGLSDAGIGAAVGLGAGAFIGTAVAVSASAAAAA